jgi:hypothetical protein
VSVQKYDPFDGDPVLREPPEPIGPRARRKRLRAAQQSLDHALATLLAALAGEDVDAMRAAGVRLARCYERALVPPDALDDGDVSGGNPSAPPEDEPRDAALARVRASG